MRLVAYLMHLGLGTIVAMYSAEFSAGVLKLIFQNLWPAASVNWIVTLVFGPFYVLQILTAFGLGIASVRRWMPEVGPFVFLLPLTFFIARFFFWSPSSIFESWRLSTAIAHFFGDSCQIPDCWDQLFTTVPLYTAFAYSVGSWTAIRYTKRIHS